MELGASDARPRQPCREYSAPATFSRVSAWPLIWNTSPRHAVCSTADLPTEKSHDTVDCKCEPCIGPDLHQPWRVGTNEVERSSQPDLYHQGDRGQSCRSANGATRPGKGSQ